MTVKMDNPMVEAIFRGPPVADPSNRQRAALMLSGSSENFASSDEQILSEGAWSVTTFSAVCPFIKACGASTTFASRFMCRQRPRCGRVREPDVALDGT